MTADSGPDRASGARPRRCAAGRGPSAERARVLRDMSGGGGRGEQTRALSLSPIAAIVPVAATSLLGDVLSAVGIGISGSLLGLIVFALYGRKALRAGRLAGQTVRYLLVVAAVLVVGLLTGIVPTLRVERAVSIGGRLVDLIAGVVG